MLKEYGFCDTLNTDEFNAELYMDHHNSRVKLLDYNGNIGTLAKELVHVCNTHRLGKIICTVYEKDIDAFLNNGFLLEGKIEGYFKGEPAYCVSHFIDKERAISHYISEEDAIIKKSLESAGTYDHSLKHDFTLRTAKGEDADQLAHLFRVVFKTYPTPMNDPAYIKKIIKNQVLFKVIEVNHEIVSAASADMNRKYLNAEITDCATFENFRGKGFLSDLVYHLEADLRQMGFITVFSLSRAHSTGINIVFSKHGYEYSGRHINNCNIMGSFEDMNIWTKKLSSAKV